MEIYDPYSQQAPEIYEFYHYQWNAKRCQPCSIAVDDLGGYQCTDCLCMFDENQIIKPLEESYGESWPSRFRDLVDIKRLVQNGRTEKLKRLHYAYFNEDGTIKTDRNFYEKYEGDKVFCLLS